MIVVDAAPWIALAFAIGAAVAAQYAFNHTSEAGPETPWQEAALPADRDREIAERKKRYKLEISGASDQTLATYLAAGSALEATAASQQGFVALTLVVLGAVLAAVGWLMRVVQRARRNAYESASILAVQWRLEHKHLSVEEKETGFAREHPREAKAIKNAPPSWW